MLLHTMPMEKRKGIAGRHIVSCGTPAQKARDVLRTGNGAFLVEDGGKPDKETLTFWREELWAPQWEQPPKAPEIAAYLPEVRRLILAGQAKEAAELADIAAGQHGCPPTLHGNPKHPALMLQIEQPVAEAADYLHTLDMATGVIATRWSQEGSFSREIFVSREDGVAVIRLCAPAGKLVARIQGEAPARQYERGDYGPNDLPYEDGSGKFTCLPVAPTVAVTHAAAGEQASIILEGHYAYHAGGFTTAVRIVAQGSDLQADTDGIVVSHGTQAVILVACRRNYHVQLDGDGVALLDSLKALPSDYGVLLRRHVEKHRPLFERLSVNLGAQEEDYLLTTAELKRQQFTSDGIVPAYMEAMVDMGRFFLLTESGKFPPIYGHVNINVNHQISGGNIGNLPEAMESFFRWIEWQLPAARENARRILGTRGFLIACHPDEESGNLIHFNRCWPHQYWISSSGWCLQPFLEHYYCTGDKAFLRERALPLYRELALLYEDYLEPRDENGRRMFIPSYSPENFPANIPAMTNINAVMDISVCREVLSVLTTLGVQENLVSEEECARWQKLLAELPPYLTDAHGELKEWARADHAERYDHRHASHLYGAYPGDEFQPELDAALYEAAFIANRMRALGNESCHGVMHRAQAAARLKDRHLVNQLLRFTLESGYVTDAFTTTHNPYVSRTFPDGQGALPTVLLESLLYSRPGFLEPLPALPQGCFRCGELRGMASRAFAHIDSLQWDLEAGEIRLRFTALADTSLTLCCRAAHDALQIDGAQVLEEEGKYYALNLRAGEVVCARWTGVRL